jgi:hypothetical protein
MKKIIINTIIISLLSITAIFADNNTASNNNVNNSTNNYQLTTNNQIAVVTINDMNGKVVYTQTFTIDNKNESNIKLNPDHKLTRGMYVVTVVADGQKMTQKLIVE